MNLCFGVGCFFLMFVSIDLAITESVGYLWFAATNGIAGLYWARESVKAAAKKPNLESED